jgi:16S rRNA (guanine966-N2)-methyltransferase
MRIVAGEFKGRRLTGPPGAATRPTSDRVREALFSILGDISGQRVLDLFAGTGALALEALSRGARSAVLVERDRAAIKVAERNIDAVLGERASRARLVKADAIAYLKNAENQAFGLVLIDPPYDEASALASTLAELLPAVLAPGATVVAECDRRAPLRLAGESLCERSEHRYGDTLLRIFDAL